MPPAPRATAAMTVFVAANAIWVAAVIAEGMDALYVVADVLCVGAAGLLLAGFARSSPLLLAAGAVGSLVCQGPFYGFATGWIGWVAQVSYVGACVALLAAAWAWWHETPATRTLVRASGWLFLLTSAGWILDWTTLWNLFQLGNVTSGVAAILLMRAEDPRAA